MYIEIVRYESSNKTAPLCEYYARNDIFNMPEMNNFIMFAMKAKIGS